MAKKPKTFSIQKKNHDHAPIDELVQHLPPFSPASTPSELMIKKTMLSSSICLLSLYGKQIETYINHALIFPANNPKAFADQITQDVLGQVFPPNYHPEFNQYVSISTSLLLERFEELSQSQMSLNDAIQKIKANQEDFITHEIDAIIYVSPATTREKWMEIKLFTCPNQSSKVLTRHLQPTTLKSYFTTNDYLGLMGFSMIYTEDHTPFPYQKAHPKELANMSGWMIHLLLFDQGICQESRSTTILGDWLLSQIRVDLTEMTTKLGLNTYDCFFSMTENFVKVVKMAQIIEEYKKEQEERDQEIKKIRLEKEQERREKEQERREKEQARQEIAELKRKLAKYENPPK